MNEIATASSEQTNGIEQISKAIQQMDQVVQQNAANAEETAAASEELSSQAQGLNGLVDKIASEVNMGDDGDGKVGKSDASKKREREHSEEGFVPLKKKLSPIHKKASHVVKREDGGKDLDKSRANTLEETSSEGNGKEPVTAEVKASRLIPLSDDEFKDF